MKVRELIENLLHYDMESDIEIQLDLTNKSDWYDFDFEDNLRSKEVYLTVDLDGSELIDSDRLEELEELEESQ